MAIQRRRVEDYAGDQLRPPRGGQVKSAEQVAVFLQGGPGDRAIREFHADTEAVVRQLLAINDLPPGRTRIQGSNAHDVAGLPGALRENASAVPADVVGEGLFSIGSRGQYGRKAHHNDDQQPPFDSASGPMVQRDLA